MSFGQVVVMCAFVCPSRKMIKNQDEAHRLKAIIDEQYFKYFQNTRWWVFCFYLSMSWFVRLRFVLSFVVSLAEVEFMYTFHSHLRMHSSLSVTTEHTQMDLNTYINQYPLYRVFKCICIAIVERWPCKNTPAKSLKVEIR